MVTDEKYNSLVKRVDELEAKLRDLARRYDALYMKNDGAFSSQEKSNEIKKKDVTRYRFNGELLCKRKLVLNCVKWYIRENNIKEYSELIECFPDYIQGSLGVIRQVDSANGYKKSDNRFFFKDEYIIHLSEGDYVVCSQWDAHNIERFLALAEELNMKIEKVSRKYR